MSGHIHWGRFIGRLQEICKIGEKRHLAVIVIEETDDKDGKEETRHEAWDLARSIYDKILRRLLLDAVKDPGTSYDDVTVKTIDAIFEHQEN